MRVFGLLDSGPLFPFSHSCLESNGQEEQSSPPPWPTCFSGLSLAALFSPSTVSISPKKVLLYFFMAYWTKFWLFAGGREI